MIRRTAYIRSPYRRADGTYVKSVTVKSKCIKDRGTPGKGPKLIKNLRKGTLSNFGYKNVRELSLPVRQKSLEYAVKKWGPMAVFRKLVAVRTLQKNTNPHIAKIFGNDARWIRERFLRR